MLCAEQEGTSTLSVTIKSQNNNFLLLRHILVLGVLYTHSAALLFPGAVLPDPLFAYSGFSINCASAAVCIFFTLSGLLIAQSGYAASSIDEFLTKRWLRIFPAFLAAIGVSYLALPAFFNIPLVGIFRDSCHFGIVSYVEIAVLFALSILLLRWLQGTRFYKGVGVGYVALLIVLLTGATTLLPSGPRTIGLFNYLHTCAGTGVHVRGSTFENVVINLSIWFHRYEFLMSAIVAFYMFFPKNLVDDHE